MPTAHASHPQVWWRRMLGPRSISWQAVVSGNGLISLALIASGGTLGGYAFGPDARSRALVMVLVVGVVTSAWAIFAFTVLFRHRRVRPVSLATFVLYYAGNGFLYFLGVQWLDVTSGAPSGIGWPARLVSSMAISLVWGIAFSLLLDSSDRFHARRQELLEEMVEAEVTRVRESQEALRIRQALDAQVDEVLESTRTRLSSALESSVIAREGGTGTQAAAAAALVRTAASDVVRPLSHDLQERADAAFPAPRVSGVLRQWWVHPRMPPLATALLVSSQTTAESVRNFGGAAAPLVSLLYFAGLYLLLVLIDRTARRFPRWGRPVYLVGVLGSLALNVGFAEGLSPDPVSMGDVAANVLFSITYIAITSLFDAVRQAREGLLESLASEVDAEEVRSRALQRETAAVVDSLARELHGRVQTQLVVCAAELERAAEAGDHPAVMVALAQAASALESATHPQRLILTDVVAAWSAVMTVMLDVESVPAGAKQRDDVVAVVEEGLANAYRHGGASTVSVSLRLLSDSLRVVMVDDGAGVGEVVPGLGSQLMRRLSADRTTLESRSEGTVLTVDLPLSSD